MVIFVFNRNCSIYCYYDVVNNVSVVDDAGLILSQVFRE